MMFREPEAPGTHGRHQEALLRFQSRLVEGVNYQRRIIVDPHAEVRP
jgi:hypothetical protein